MTMKVLYLRHFSKDLDKLDSEDLKGEVFNVIQMLNNQLQSLKFKT
jgi:mRNA-degrading endonuclease RelE of RelBE toxin-antitoxin system